MEPMEAACGNDCCRKYAQLVVLIETRIGHYNNLADGARDIHWRGRWATVADSLRGLLPDD